MEEGKREGRGRERGRGKRKDGERERECSLSEYMSTRLISERKQAYEFRTLEIDTKNNLKCN
jgi:hypothetical protein